MRTLGLEQPSKTSVVGHFRVSKEVYGSLEDEAKTQMVSLNALVGRVLSTHVRDDSIFEEIGAVKLPKDAFRLLLGLIPDEKLSEYGELVIGIKRTMMIAKSNSLGLDAILEELRSMSRSGWFSYHESMSNGKRTITLVHGLGPRYSVVCAVTDMALFGLVGISPKITTTDSSIMIQY